MIHKLIVFLLFILSSQAQIKKPDSLQLFFESAAYKLTPEHKKQIADFLEEIQMLLEKKDYEMLKVKTYLKSENFTFLSDGVNRNPRKLLKVEQDLKALGYCSYKVLNRITLKTLNDSIYPNVKPLFNGLSFFIRPFIFLSPLIINLVFAPSVNISSSRQSE